MYFAHTNATEQLISSYKPVQPFINYLKDFFKKNKKMGASDRRTIGNYCFNYFRWNNALPNLSFVENLQLALYAIDNVKHPNLPHYNLLSQRLEAIKNTYPSFSLFNINNTSTYFSKAINVTDALYYQLTKPMVFVRIVNKADLVKTELTKNNIAFIEIDTKTLSIASAAKLTQLQVYADGCFEIQDYASQLCLADIYTTPEEFWWDCCAGAGGKSLYFKQNNPETKLLVSDIRQDVLQEAGNRFKKTGLKKIEIKMHDAVMPLDQRFDGIIVDAPCSGSGTWKRAPEHYRHFDVLSLNSFKHRQIALIKNAWLHLKPGGKLIYITCSMFAAENEDVINEANQFCNAHVSHTVINGNVYGADIMFRAVFTKSS